MGRVCSLIEAGWVFVGKLGHRSALPDPEDGQKHPELVLEDPEPVLENPESVLEDPEPILELSRQQLKVGILTIKSPVTDDFTHHVIFNIPPL